MSTFQEIWWIVTSSSEIVMVRLQGDFAKPPEKRFNYKNCFDALFRVSYTPASVPFHLLSMYYSSPTISLAIMMYGLTGPFLGLPSLSFPFWRSAPIILMHR